MKGQDSVNKLPTMSDVAKKAGVSRQLVSLVMNNSPGPSDATRQKVLDAAREINYHPHFAAKMLRSNHTNIIGICFTLRQSFHEDLIETIYPLAKKEGYEILLSATTDGRSCQDAISELINFRCEAIILLDSQMEPDEWKRIDRQVPIIIAGKNVPGRNIDYVCNDDAYGVKLAVEYLVKLCHSKIIFLDGGEVTSSEERRNAYLQTMQHLGLRDYMQIIPGNATEESGCRAAQEIIYGTYQPTAVLATNDRSAIGLMTTLKQEGIRIPQDISIIGYDDIFRASMSHINLTTIRQDIPEMARSILCLARERLADHRTKERGIILKPELIVRGSSCPPAE